MGGGCISNSQVSNGTDIYRIIDDLKNSGVCPDRKSIDLYKRPASIIKLNHIEACQLLSELRPINKFHPIDRYYNLGILPELNVENDMPIEKKSFCEKFLEKAKNFRREFANFVKI